MDAAAIGSELKGVTDQIEEDAAQFLHIHIHHQLRLRGIYRKVDMALGGF